LHAKPSTSSSWKGKRHIFRALLHRPPHSLAMIALSAGRDHDVLPAVELVGGRRSIARERQHRLPDQLPGLLVELVLWVKAAL
jgi:hypothetical protein